VVVVVEVVALVGRTGATPVAVPDVDVDVDMEVVELESVVVVMVEVVEDVSVLITVVV
jgi:hypothetical protein